MAISPALYSSASEEWSTPRDFLALCVKAAGRPFDLDACATRENAVCASYLDKELDGLKSNWAKAHSLVWCNPPYNRMIGKWVTKAVEESRKGATVYFLVHARTDTKWFANAVAHANEITFITGRLHFGGSKTGAPFPSVLMVFGPGYRKAPMPEVQWINPKEFYQ